MTALLLAAALAYAEEPAAPTPTTSPWGFGAAAEYDIVGQNVGVRLDGLWLPGTRRVNGARVGLGILPGPEYFYLPVSLGWRARTGPNAPHLHALFGAGAQAELFFITDHPMVARQTFYGELGGAWSVKDHVDVGLMVVPELTVFGVPGIGLGVRLGVWWD